MPQGLLIKRHTCSVLALPCRSDKCAARGCIPYTYTCQAAALNLVAKHLEDERVDEDGCRFPADCIDLQRVVMWAQKAKYQVSMKVALFGCCVFSRFNSVRTFGVLMWHGALASTCPDWKTCKGTRYCNKRWGALYCKMNMAGSGFPKATGVTKERNVIIGLQSAGGATACMRRPSS